MGCDAYFLGETHGPQGIGTPSRFERVLSEGKVCLFSDWSVLRFEFRTVACI